jgi:GNAT superfamily N-acetyltransferase
MTSSKQYRAVRHALLEEAAAIAALINEAYLVESFFVAGPRTTDASIRAFIENSEMLALGDEAGRVVAAAHLKISNSGGHLGLISVRPASQGQGLGRRIIAAAEALALSHQCHTMHIQVVNLRTELPPFYEALGYRHKGTSDFADPGRTLQPVHFLEMEKSLQVS